MDIAKKYHVILCDDVRNEVGNKLSIHGRVRPRTVGGQAPGNDAEIYALW